jgi:hypothetical protein
MQKTKTISGVWGIEYLDEHHIKAVFLDVKGQILYWEEHKILPTQTITFPTPHHLTVTIS